MLMLMGMKMQYNTPEATDSQLGDLARSGTEHFWDMTVTWFSYVKWFHLSVVLLRDISWVDIYSKSFNLN